MPKTDRTCINKNKKHDIFSCGRGAASAVGWAGPRSAPLCTQAILMAHFAGRREIGVKFPMRAASVDPKSTQLTPLTILHFPF